MPRNYRIVSDIDRNRIIEKYESGEDFLTTARELGIKRTTAYQIIRKHQEAQENEREIRIQGRKKKLSDEAVDFLILLVESTSTITIRELNTTLREIFTHEPQVSDATVSRALEGALITRKLCENINENRNSQRIKVARAEYAHEMYARNLQTDRIYCI